MNRVIFLACALAISVACGDDGGTPIAPTRGPSRLTLEAFPTSVLLSQSTIQITARLTNDRGENLVSHPIQFSASSGSFDNAAPLTNSSGLATVRFTGDQATTIVATADSARDELAVSGIPPYTLRLTLASTASPLATEIDINVVQNPSVVAPPRPRTVVLDCGTGVTKDITNATFPSRQRCDFPQESDQPITVRAQSANGWTLTESVRATAAPARLTFDTVVARGRGTGSREVQFTLAANVPFQQIEWQFGDGAGSSGPNRLQETHLYTAAGTYTVRVSGIPVGGITEARAERTITLVACDGTTLCLQ